MRNETHNKTAWLTTLLTHLPPDLRPNDHDTRLLAACAVAYHNGWPPDQLAQTIASRNYARTTNRPLIAIMRLEEIALYPPPDNNDRPGEKWRQNLPQHCPHTPAQTRELNPNQCTQCRTLAGAPAPTRNPDQLPAHWQTERAQLLRHCIRHHLGETETVQRMGDLIQEQRNRPLP